MYKTRLVFVMLSAVLTLTSCPRKNSNLNSNQSPPGQSHVVGGTVEL